MRHVSELLVPRFGRPALLSRGKMPRTEGWLHTYEMVTGIFDNQNISIVVSKYCFGMGLWCETELVCIQSLPKP